MYLKEDYIGAASGVVYGYKGDFVTIIRTEVDMTFVENNNIKFFIKNEKLSKEKVDPSPKVAKESTREGKQVRKRKR